MVLWLRVRPWTLLLPAWTLGFALAGPNPRFAPWRDAVLTLCLITVIPALWVPKTWPMPMRLTANAPGTAGVVFLVVACFHNDGLGAAVRKRSWRALVASGRAAAHGIVAIVGLLISSVMAAYLLREPTPLRLLFLATLLGLNARMIPERWARLRDGMGPLGCLGYVLVTIGAFKGHWPKSFFFLFVMAGSAAESWPRLRQFASDGGPALNEESVAPNEETEHLVESIEVARAHPLTET